MGWWWRMLTLTALTDAEYLISSVALSIDEYYAGVGESPGVWAGKWAEELRLSGVVEAEQLRALVEGRDPVSGAELLAGNRERSVRAFDMTFSAPKSVSLLWAFATDPVAEVVAAAHREAVAEALAFLEERAAVARVQAGGVRRRVATEGWAVAAFTHRTSREGDPQLHSHCLVPNLVRRKTDGRYVALDAGPLFDWCRAAGSVYQDHLQRSLSLRLGVVWGPDRHNTREIIGLSREQLRAFSKRSAQIEAELEAKGALYESPALRMQADDEASLATRTAKDHSLTPTLLQGRWREEAAAVGLATGTELEEAVCWKEPPLDAPTWEEVAATLVDPEVGLCSRSARFTAADVVEHICAVSGGRLSVAEVVTMAERFLASELVVRLTPDVEEGRRRPAQWSTAAHRAMEDRTLALMGALAGRQVPAVKGAVLEAALAAAPALGEDQAAAVKVLAGEGGGLRAVLAPAGYGKTTMLHAAAQAAAADGRPVVAVATTAKAVAELAGAGLDARTIARLRLDLANGPLAAGTVVVLDEVSQTPTHEVEAVLAAVDACPGGSVWVLGDPRQSQPVGAGGVADHIERLANEGLVPSARLTVNRRQVDPADQEALGLLRRGDAAASQQLRTEHGWEHELATPGETRRTMADAVCTDIGRYGAEQVAALVVSHTDAEDLADRVRARLAATGAAHRPGPGRPGVDGRAGVPGGGQGAPPRPLRPLGQPARQRHHRHGHRRRRSWAHRPPRRQRGSYEPADGVRAGHPQGRFSQPFARLGTHGGRGAGRHLGSLPPARQRRPGRLPGLHRPVPFPPAHPHLEHRPGRGRRPRRCPCRPAGRGRTGRRCARPPARPIPGRTQRPLGTRPSAPRADRRARKSAGRPAPRPPRGSGRRDQGPPGSRELPGRQGGSRLPHGRPAGGDGRARRVDPTGQRAAPPVAGQVGLRRRSVLLRPRTTATSLPAVLPSLRREQDMFDRFEAAEGWRRDDISRLRGQLDHHWAEVVAACVQADDPLAYGVDKLRHARATTAGDLRALDARVPVDRATERDDARRQLADALTSATTSRRGARECTRRLRRERAPSVGT